MKRGFQFAEVMTGSYALVQRPAEERHFSFSVRVRARSLLQFLRDNRATIEGMLEAEGLADHVPIHGSMVIAPLTRRLIAYEFNFTGNDGQPYHFSGQKQLELGSPVRTLTELPAEIHDGAGTLLATCRLRFDVRSELASFLASWRLA